MATKLKNLKIKRVALVDEGANPDAYIKFAKNHEQTEAQPELTGEEAQNLLKRFAAFVTKAFSLQKSATTFAEAEAQRDFEQVMDKEVYPMHYAFIESVRSILADKDEAADEKAVLLRRSLSEFVDAVDERIDEWVNGELTEVKLRKSDYSMDKLRDHLNALIAKRDGEPPAQEETNTEPEPTNDTPVSKGEIDMIFDTTKMTPEELATYEDLAKRFGSEDKVTPAPEAPATPAVEQQSEENDVFKGLHPAVKAELETLRKFREASEDKQYLEVAKKYELLGKKPEELAPVLKSLKAAGGTAYDDMIGLLDTNLQAVEKSGMFTEIGKRGQSNEGDAWKKIEQAAQEIIKSKPDMRWPDAVDAACLAHPELVAAYEKARA